MSDLCHMTLDQLGSPSARMIRISTVICYAFVTGDLLSHPTRGLGAGAAAFCRTSPAFPLAESFPAPDASAIRSTASAVVHTTAYRHRVTFAVLRRGLW
jgi:hypothetical protein